MTKHIPALDGLRGVAALTVLCYHLLTPLAQGTPFWYVVQFGWVGVDLFFVLSGFLITGILYDALGSEGYFRTFYTRRALRIFPLYYGFLLVIWLASPLFGHGERFADFAWPMLTYTQNLPWGKAYPMDIGHTWSLAVEEQFYLLWPALIYSVRDRTRLMKVCVALIIGAFVWRVLSPTPFIAYAQLPARVDALAIGGFVALWSRGREGIQPVAAAARRWWPLIAAGVVLCGVLAGTERVYFAWVQRTVGYSLWALLFACALTLAVHRGSRLLESRPLRYTGRVSYALYLFHPPIIFAMTAFGMTQGWTFVLIAGVLTYLLAALSWRYFEGPILRLRERTKREPVPAPVVVIA